MLEYTVSDAIVFTIYTSLFFFLVTLVVTLIRQHVSMVAIVPVTGQYVVTLQGMYTAYSLGLLNQQHHMIFQIVMQFMLVLIVIVVLLKNKRIKERLNHYESTN